MHGERSNRDLYGGIGNVCRIDGIQRLRDRVVDGILVHLRFSNAHHATDSIANASSADTIAATTQAPQVDSRLSQTMLSGSTDNGACTSGNVTLTATDMLQNTSGSDQPLRRGNNSEPK
jgi:hypothetical protein